MSERIEINGTWYVKEQVESINEFDVTYYQGAICESDTASFEFSHLQRDKNLTLWDNTQSIEYTNKHTKFVDYWDSEDFILQIPDGYHDKELLEMLSIDDLKMLKSFITELISIDLL